MANLDRLAIGRLLAGRAEFLKIRDDSKVPQGSFKPGRRNRYKRIPRTGNYGILPQGTLFILDLDTHGGGSLQAQVDFFSDFLEVDLSQTFAVDTPSGGLHYYLEIPPCELTIRDLPKTNLRPFKDELQAHAGHKLTIDADIRSEAANAYVLGPDCLINDESYSLRQDLPIATIGEAGFRRLVSLRSQRTAKIMASKTIDIWKDDPTPLLEESAKRNSLPPMKTLRKLTVALQARSQYTYHQQRAFVKAALHCCYTNDAIVKTCIDLDINRDSSKARYLTRYMLQLDIQKVEVSRTFHGPYCPRVQAKQQAKETFNPEVFAAHLEQKLRERVGKQAGIVASYRHAAPRVLAYEKIIEALLSVSPRGANSKQYSHALSVVEAVLQPLANLGAVKMLLGQDFLAEELALTKSQVAQALRILRAAGVIEVQDRQKQGFAPTYSIPERFVHRRLTFYLKRTWIEANRQGEGEPLIYLPRRGGFVGALSSATVASNVVTDKISLQDLTFLNPSGSGSRGTLVARYLRIDA